VLRLVLALALLSAAPVQASDFWDEVRTPGLRDWNQDIRRARAALRARRLEQARTAANTAVERLPDRSEGYVVRGIALGELGDLDGAARDLARALELDEAALDESLDGARAAEILSRHGEYELAAEVLGRVLGRMRAGSGRRALYGLYGDVLLTLGPARADDAVRAYREALRNARYDPRASLGLALALYRQGDRLESLDLARAVAARGRLDALLGSLTVPDAERAARRGLALQAIDDLPGARTAWTEAGTDGTWGEKNQQALEALRAPARRGRR